MFRSTTFNSLGWPLEVGREGINVIDDRGELDRGPGAVVEVSIVVK